MLITTAIQFKTAMRIFYVSLNSAKLVACNYVLLKTILYAIVISRT